MLKKVLVCSALSMFVLGGAVQSLLATSDPGPEEITMVYDKSKKPKPAIFPHKKHQEAFKCGECHHGMADGKRTDYAEGMEIQKCETCHTGDTLAGKKLGKLKLDTIKGAGHGNCLACHKELAKADPGKKELKKCSTCHPKKKK